VVAFRNLEGAARYVRDLEEGPPALDLLITDYRLENGVTGGDVIRAVRAALRMAHPEHSFELPAIIITGDTDPARLSQAQGVGATLLHKPIDTQVLYDELAKVHVRRDKKAALIALSA
jgi:CheY-like chemotaxis protein